MTLFEVAKINAIHFKNMIDRQMLNTLSVMSIITASGLLGAGSWAGPYDDYYRQLKKIPAEDDQAKQNAFFNSVQKPKLKFFEESLKRGHEESLATQSSSVDDDEFVEEEKSSSATPKSPNSSRSSRSGPSSFSTAGGNVESGNATEAIIYGGGSSKKKNLGPKKTKRRGY